MKNLIKFVMVVVAVSLISGAGYAKKDNTSAKADKKMADASSKQASDQANEVKDKADKKAQKVKNDAKDQVKDANAADAAKKSGRKKFLGFAYGKDNEQQLKALDEKAVKADSKNKDKIAGLEKELAAAQAANDTKKAEKIEKKLADTKQKADEEMKSIDTKRAKIKAEMAK